MATSSSVPLFNTDPNIQAQAALLQQQQAMAQELLKQGMTPLDTTNRSIGGVAYHVSPLEGIGKMLQAYAGKTGMQDATQQQAALSAQAYGNLLQRYGTGAGPSYSQDQLSGAAAQGMDGDGMGPPDPQKMAAALQGQAPANSGVNPNNPIGIPPQILAQRNAGMMDDETFKALISPYAATDATKAAIQGGGNVASANQQALAKSLTDSKIYAMQQAGLSPQQIYAAQLGEAAKGAEIGRKPGEQFVNPVLGASGMVPKIPDNANPVGPVAPNGALPGGVAPLPGATGVTQGNAQAGATGTANGSFQSVTMPDGSVRPIRGAEVPAVAPQPGVKGAFQGDPADVMMAIADIRDPQQRANAAAAFTAQMRNTPPGAPLKLGQSTADKVTQEAGGKAMADLPMQIQQSKQTVNGLENAYKTIEAVGKSGPGMSKTVDALAVLNSLGVPVMKGDVNGFQTLKKYLENSASVAAAANGSTGSDARFEQFKAGQPNADSMSPDALKGAIRYVLSQHDASIARGQFIQQQAQANGSDPNAIQKAQQQWSQAYNPRVFEFSRMTPQERAQAKTSMSADQRQKFGQQYNFAHQQGWVQ